MDFKAITGRAQTRGYNVVVFQINPEPQAFSSVMDKDLTDALAIGFLATAKKFAELNGDKVPTAQVLLTLLKEVQKKAFNLAKIEADPEAELSDEEKALLARTEKLINAGSDDTEDGSESAT